MRQHRLSRLYSDLVFQCADYYPNWDPSVEIRVGDYGILDEKSGRFQREGNVLQGDLKKVWPIEEHTQEREHKIKSSGVEELGFEVHLEGHVPGVADCEVKSRWSFSERPGVVLHILEPTLIQFPNPGQLLRLFRSSPHLSANRNLQLVTHVVRCTSYFIMMTDGSKGEAAFGLKAVVPGPSGGGTMGAGAELNWITSGNYAITKHADKRAGKLYYPLFDLRVVKWFGRQLSRPRELSPRSPTGVTENQEVVRFYPPWGALGREGEEIFASRDYSEAETVEAQSDPSFPTSVHTQQLSGIASAQESEACLTPAIHLQNAESSFIRFNKDLCEADLQSAILSLRHYLAVADEDQLGVRIRLSTALRRRFEIERRGLDIEESILLAELARLKATNEDEPLRPSHSRALGRSLIAWLFHDIRRQENDSDHLAVTWDGASPASEDIAESSPDLEDVDLVAVALCQLTESSSSKDNPGSDLLQPSITGQSRPYHVMANMKGLKEAIGDVKDAIDSLFAHRGNETHQKSGVWNDFGTYLNSVYGYVQAEKLAKVIQNPTLNHTARWYLVASSYYAHLFTGYMTHSKLDNLDTSIVGLHRIVQMMPASSRDYISCVTILGSALERAFAQYGKVTLLDKSVSLLKAALPNARQEEACFSLRALGWAYHTRYVAHGYSEDLENAIASFQQAAACGPESNQAYTLSFLADALADRFNLKHEIQDVNMAISVLEAPPPPGQEYPLFLSGQQCSLLGNIMLLRFSATGDEKDLTNAVATQRKALDLLPDKHAFRPTVYFRLGIAHLKGYDPTQKVAQAAGNALRHIDPAIAAFTQSVDLTPKGSPARAAYISQLGIAMYALYGVTKDLDDLVQALRLLTDAAKDRDSFVSGRFEAAMRMASIAHNSNQLKVALEGYRLAIDMLPRVAWLGLECPLRLQRLASRSLNLCQDAVACAVAVGELEVAVEFLDRAKGVIWNSSQDLRVELNDLREADFGLADEFQSASAALDIRSLRSEMPSNMDQEQAGQNHRRLADKWDELVEKIRTRKGFESFLRPKPFAELCLAASGGFVAIANVSKFRSDVLIIQESGVIHHVPLPSITVAWAEEHANLLQGAMALEDYRREGQKEKTVTSVLHALWKVLGHPVWHVITCLHSQACIPRVWWCPTGALTRLPIHACGPYEDGEGLGLADLVMSSYAPTLSAVLRSKLPLEALELEIPVKMLGVCVDEVQNEILADLPCAQEEIEVLKQLHSSSYFVPLAGSEATIPRFKKMLRVHNWLHLCCHGLQDERNPLESHVLLYDGRLRLSEMALARLPHAEFAFLSACHTGKDVEVLPDESLHLAAGLLLAGFKSLVATQWSILDEDGPTVARIFYGYLLVDKRMNPGKAAEALHHTIKQLRKEGLPSWRRIPFVHMGL